MKEVFLMWVQGVGDELVLLGVAESLGRAERLLVDNYIAHATDFNGVVPELRAMVTVKEYDGWTVKVFLDEKVGDESVLPHIGQITVEPVQ